MCCQIISSHCTAMLDKQLLAFYEEVFPFPTACTISVLRSYGAFQYIQDSLMFPEKNGSTGPATCLVMKPCDLMVWWVMPLKRAFTPTREMCWVPAQIPPMGFTVDWFQEIAWCYLHRCVPAAPPRFFCGTRRIRERWLVSIYRSMSQCHEMGPLQIETACGPAPV